MRDLEDLVQFELESTSVDFKAIQYPKAKHADLLKDAIAMANADVEGDRFIVCGIKLHRDGSRKALGVPRDELRDAADYQQLILQNVEPELRVDYIPIELENQLVTVLRIHDCEDPPYLMKKQFGDRQAGEGWVRKGTQQLRLTRKDYDRYARLREERKAHVGERLAISFERGRDVRRIKVPSTGPISFPSQAAADRIRSILEQRKLAERRGLASAWPMAGVALTAGIMGGAVPYEQRSTETLEKNLAGVAETYAEDDAHHLFEVLAARIQLFLHNGDKRYIEDCSLFLRVPKRDGIHVPDRIHRAPVRSSPFGIHLPLATPSALQYPSVEEADDHFQVVAHLGDVPHGLWTDAFERELRAVLDPELEGETLEVEYAVHARNLPDPVTGELELEVVPPEEDT